MFIELTNVTQRAELLERVGTRAHLLDEVIPIMAAQLASHMMRVEIIKCIGEILA